MGKDIDSMITELRTIATSWRQELKRIGAILVALEAKGEPAEFYIRTILHDEYGVPMTTGRVAMRWARGDYGEDEQAQLLLAKVPHSLLSVWTEETIAAVLTDGHRIASPDSGKVVVKSIAHMSRREVTQNTGSQGFLPITKRARNIPFFRFCKAERFELDDGIGVILVAPSRREIIRMSVSRK